MKLKFRINKFTLGQALVFGLCLFTFLFPRDNYNLKKITLLVVVAYNCGVILKGYKKDTIGCIFTVFIPVYLVIVSILQTGDLYTPFTFVYFYIYYAIAYVVYRYKYNLKSMMLFVGNIIAAFILFSVLLDFFNVMPYGMNPLLRFFRRNAEAQISASPDAIGYYVFFFKGSPIILYNLIYYLSNKSYKKAFLMFSALIFSGTRANIGMAVFVLVVYLVVIEKDTKIKLLIGTILVVVFVRYGIQIGDKIRTINYVKSVGDNIRGETIKSILKILKSNPINSIVGFGFGSKYNINIHNRVGMITTSEMSYFEIIRETGFVVGTMLIGFLINPLKRLYTCDKALLLFYVCYLVEGFFEPFIFTSSGFMIIAFVYSEIFLEYDNPQMCFSPNYRYEILK